MLGSPPFTLKLSIARPILLTEGLVLARVNVRIGLASICWGHFPLSPSASLRSLRSYFFTPSRGHFLHRREAGWSRRSNSLEALVWEKEAEVDRQRDRWPMSMLVSRTRLFNQIEENKPRDLIGALSGGRKTNQVVSLLAEIKRTAPTTGPIRRGEFDVVGIAKALEEGGAAAIAVNTDRKFFGCTYEDLTNIRKAVGIPVMCSDVVVYPYQIYQARLAGADAIKLIAPALPQKDLMYFHKISAALGMQSIVAVSSVKQMLAALRLPGIRAVSINNRNMATWALDPSRVDRILFHPEVQAELKVKGKDVTLLVEAGLSTRADIERAKSAGIPCVVIGEAILRDEDPARATKALLSSFVEPP